MRPVTDMLGQFFSSRKASGAPHPSSSSSSASPNATLDSATEDSHTRHLLYPESSTLYHPDGQPYPLHQASLSMGTAHDGPAPEIDLDFPRDCRIIIAQDEMASMPKTILFDSKPSSPRVDSPTQPNARARAFGGAAGASTAGPSFGGHHARRSSLATESTPRSPTAATFVRTRTRGNSISSMPNIDEHSQSQAKAQAQAQAKAKDSSDLVNSCLDCMFGNTPMNYRGNSHKIHFVSLDPKPTEAAGFSSNIQDATNSLGRAEGLRRKSHLAQSFTPANIPADSPSSQMTATSSKEPRRRTLCITRMFSVTVPDEDQDTSNMRTPTPQSSMGKGNSFPFPGQQNNKPGGSKMLPPSRKSPMYAIGVILHLPIATPPRPTNQRGNHLSTSAPGQDSLGSSVDSDRRAGWQFVESIFGVDSLISAALNSDVDDCVDVVVQHYDVIMRSLTSLQFAVQERILAYFKMAETSSSVIPQPPRTQPSRVALRDSAPAPMRRALRLQPQALMFDKEVQKAVELAGTRIVSGMRIPRVMTGQGKWGVWREEARWLGRWAGRKEENFFLFNLLTAFLGNHTEWLNLLGPKWHRKRHRDQQRSITFDNLLIANRTVIVSPDKMAARRLIFLLAAFLPANAPTLEGASPMRPSTSASLRAHSQSPPTNIPPSRKHSLRRQINRRPRGKQSMTNMRLQPPSANTTTLPALESINGRSDSGVAEFQEASRHSRRSSAHSIRTSLVIPSMSDVPTMTKNNAAATSTTSPQKTIPVAHFTLPRTRSTGPSPEDRPESSDSLASANLMNTLNRSGTAGTISNPSTDSSNTSRWSGFMNFWSGRRGSSTGHSDYLQSTDDGLGVACPPYRAQERPRSQLEQMVQELSMDGVFGDTDPYEPSSNTTPVAENSLETYPVGSSGVPPSAARPIPERPKTFDSVLKLSVNEKDGVIDVDIPLPEFGSPLQSPLLGGCGSVSSQHGSSYGESSMLSMPYYEQPEQRINVAGWLREFHADFAVQAIKPYAELERDVKWAMRAEPTPITSAITPTLEQGPLERWVDVCSAIIADTRTFSIKRLSLRRLVRLTPTATYQATAMTPGIPGMPLGRSQYGNPYTAASTIPMMSEVHLKEEFYEEQIMDFDATLIDAVDRVLTPSGHSTRVHSASSSRSSSRRGRRDTRSGSDASHHMEVPATDCKAAIFDALEVVVKTVTDERTCRDDESNETINGHKKPARDGMAKTATDSSLKEGIRRWLAEVE